MYRRGIVTETDPGTARVRVRFPDHDNLLSWWLEVMRGRSADDKAYWMPDVGEQVAVLMDEKDEAGVVLGAIYSSADPPPVNSQDRAHVAFKDGATIDYDRAAHTLTIDLTACAGTITLRTADAQIVLSPGHIGVTATRVDLN